MTRNYSKERLGWFYWPTVYFWVIINFITAWWKSLWFIEEPEVEAEEPKEPIYPQGPLPPEYTKLPQRKGACGVVGCPNRRPHSHVMDLARRLKK
jgi:hypothetical protein